MFNRRSFTNYTKFIGDDHDFFITVFETANRAEYDQPTARSNSTLHLSKKSSNLQKRPITGIRREERQKVRTAQVPSGDKGS